ncbi:MAG TPA: hypothetical protein VF637_11140 [Sphingomicrobium sp.]|jgi:TPR repeat protein
MQTVVGTWKHYSTRRAEDDASFRAGLELARKGELAKAFKMFYRSHAKGNPDATFSLGVWHKEKLIKNHSDRIAFRYFQKAAKGKHALAFFELGRCYSEGTGVAMSKFKAEQSYLAASKLGNFDAMYNYAVVRMQRVTFDAQVERWLLKACRHGDKDAIRLMREQKRSPRRKRRVS